MYDPPNGNAGRMETRVGKDMAPITKLVPNYISTEERFDIPTTYANVADCCMDCPKLLH